MLLQKWVNYNLFFTALRLYEGKRAASKIAALFAFCINFCLHSNAKLTNNNRFRLVFLA